MGPAVTTNQLRQNDNPPGANATNRTGSFAGATMLLVENDAQRRDHVRQTLEGWGVTVTEAAEGDLKIAEARRTKPDLILLDRFLPEKKASRGRRKVRHLQRRPQVISLSGREFFKMEFPSRWPSCRARTESSSRRSTPRPLSKSFPAGLRP